jgi:hypothetical protein
MSLRIRDRNKVEKNKYESFLRELIVGNWESEPHR